MYCIDANGNLVKAMFVMQLCFGHGDTTEEPLIKGLGNIDPDADLVGLSMVDGLLHSVRRDNTESTSLPSADSYVGGRVAIRKM